MPKFLDVTNTAAAKAALKVPSINVVDYISDVDDPTTHSAGFQAAVNAALDTGVNHVIVPGGEWRVNNLVIPARSPLRISGTASTTWAFPSSSSSALDSNPTVLVRTGSQSLLKIEGPPGTGEPDESVEVDYNPLGFSIPDFARDIYFENLAFRDDNRTSLAPLISMKHAQHCTFEYVTFWSGEWGFKSSAPQIDMLGVWDAKFLNCRFLGGGDVGVPQIWIHGSDGEVYSSCQEFMFLNTENTNYYGPAFIIGDDDPSAEFGVPAILQFVNHKMESKQLGATGNSDDPHFVVKIGTAMHFKNFYIAHQKSTGPILSISNCAGVYGDVGFNFLGGVSDTFSEMVLLDDSYLVDLDVYPYAPTRVTDNIVTLTGTSQTDPSVDVRVHGPSRLINGRYKDFRRIEAGVVSQIATDDNDQLAYFFAKEGRSAFSIGNVANPAGDTEIFTVRALNPANAAQNTDIASFRVYNYASPGVLNPTTALRDVTIDATLNLNSSSLGWVNFPVLSANPSNALGGLQLFGKNNGGGGSRNEMHVYGDSAAKLVETRGVATTTSTSSLTINSDQVQHQTVSALANDLTINAPTGTPTAGQRLTIAIKDNGGSRALTWNAAFQSLGVLLPARTVAGELLTVQTEWSPATSKWQVTSLTPTNDYSRFVCKTVFGGAGAEDGANTWAKIATVATGTNQYSGATLILGFVDIQSGETAIVSVGMSSLNTNSNPQCKVEIIGKAGSATTFGPDSFKVVSGAWSTNMELWLKKADNYCQIAVYEIAKIKDLASSITYTVNPTWQSATPSGAVNNVSSAGVTAFGNPVATKVAVPANASASGRPGHWAADSSYIYAYTGDGSTHTWVRATAASW